MRKHTRKLLIDMQIDQVILKEKSRDDIPQLLEGLKYIFLDETLRQKIFDILLNIFPKTINLHDGRPGMDMWSIFVIAVLRVNLNCDYDRIHNLVNNHKTIRQILGHGVLDDQESYCLQTLKDNVSLLTPEILSQIDQLVIQTGHEWIKKK
jgi:transposase, IS5 family